MPLTEDLTIIVSLVMAALAMAYLVALRSIDALANAAARIIEADRSTVSRLSRRIKAWLRAKRPRLYGYLARRLDPRVFLGLPLTLTVLAALYIAAIFGGLVEGVLESDGVVRFDQTVNTALTPWRISPLIDVFRWVTMLGDGPVIITIAIVLTAILSITLRSAFIVPLWVVLVSAQATTWLGKQIVARPRPEFIQGVVETSSSFPSGHATAITALFGFLAYAFARDLQSLRKRFEIVFWTAVLILAIDVSRVFLSVHYLSDVLAGNLVGCFWLLVGFALTEWRRARKQGVFGQHAAIKKVAAQDGAPRS